MRTIFQVSAAFVVTLLFVSSSFAQVGPNIKIGARLGTDVAGDIEEEFIGVDARIGLPSLPVVINPAFDFYFTPDAYDFFQFSVNALLELNTPALPNVAPYAGAGLGISRISTADVDTPFGNFSASDTDIGLNLVGGASLSAGSFTPFAQLQLTLGSPDLVTVAIGILFNVSG